MIAAALLTSPASGANNLELRQTQMRVLSVSQNKHGAERATLFLPGGVAEQYYYLTRPGAPHVILTDGAYSVWVGRVVGVKQERGGVRLTALGYWSALDDRLYTALWSSTRTDAFRPTTSSDFSSRAPEKYELDTANRLFIGLRKNETYTQNTHAGEYTVAKPHNSTKGITTIAFDYSQLLPNAIFRFSVTSYTDAFGSPAVINDLNGSGVVQSGALCLPITAADRIGFAIYNYNAATHNYTGETGANYLRISNLRITTNALAVSTTLSANASAAAVSISVTSAAGMVVGMSLYLGGGNPERVTITSIVGTTIGISALANAKTSGDSVRAQAVYADEIVRDIITLNSAQLNTATVAVESPGLDLRDEIYEDASPMDVLNKLAGLGDNQTPPRQWEVGVDAVRAVYFRPQSSAARTWYIDVEVPEFDKQLGPLRNRIVATYREASGRTLRTAAASDQTSIDRWGVTREGVVSTQSTNATEASVYRDAALNDLKDPKPKAAIRVRALFDINGNRFSFYSAKPGDTYVIRNLGVGANSAAIDRLRAFRATRTVVEGGQLILEPEAPPDTLEVQVARAAEGF